MKLYLDVSCLNRPFDDQRQPRVRIESEAVLLILRRVDQGIYSHASSEIASIEINAIKDVQRRNRILSMLPRKSDIVPLNEVLFHRAQELQQYGIKPADALHVAAAESHRADVFLTCDDRLFKAARRNKKMLGVQVNNPVTWIEDHEQR